MIDPAEFGAAMGALIREATAPLLKRIEELDAREPQKGEPGRDAPPVDVQAIEDAVVHRLLDSARLETLADLVATKAVAEHMAVKQPSVTVDDLAPIVEAGMKDWALDFERRAQGVLERAIDRFPKPKDGEDGRDGLDLRHFKAEQVDDRTVTLTLGDGERTEHVHLHFPVVLDKGFWKDGTQAEAGDGYTFGGSYWIAQKDTDAKPEVGNPEWRLAVRKGRDARTREVKL